LPHLLACAKVYTQESESTKTAPGKEKPLRAKLLAIDGLFCLRQISVDDTKVEKESIMRLRNVPGLPMYAVGRAIRYLREFSLEHKITRDGPGAKIIVLDYLLPIKIWMGQDASFILKGKLIFQSHCGRRDPIVIKLESKASLTIAGDFVLGNGCEIYVAEGGRLHIEGRRHETVAGITALSRIHARRRVTIGADLLCAWDVFITDFDGHELIGKSNTEDTEIGDHVWIASRCSVLKGSKIGNGCILATGAVTHNATYPDRSLVGGIPAKVLAEDRDWAVDLKPLTPQS
jgi:acetyltransferase-like isoleucine patch superfamily enzyme